MTFSDFANMLYPIIGGVQKPSEFVCTLEHHIMLEPDRRIGKKMLENDNYYPLDQLADDMLGRIFKGTRPLSKKSARSMLSRLSKKTFIDYLSEFSDDTTDLIYKTLQDNGIIIENSDETYDTCANLFGDILLNCTLRPRNTSPKNVHFNSNGLEDLLKRNPSITNNELQAKAWSTRLALWALKNT